MVRLFDKVRSDVVALGVRKDVVGGAKQVIAESDGVGTKFPHPVLFEQYVMFHAPFAPVDPAGSLQKVELHAAPPNPPVALCIFDTLILEDLVRLLAPPAAPFDPAQHSNKKQAESPPFPPNTLTVPEVV